MEMGIPCIVGAAEATRLLKDGSTVTLDATEGVVYGWESTESEQSSG
jgi:pyruvate,water dikinase